MAHLVSIRSSLAMLLVGLSVPLLAQDKPVVPDADFEALMDLLNTPVKSASKVAQRPMDAPSTITPVSRNQLRTYGWDTINEVLFAQPGFSPSMDYDRRTVSARGQFEGWNNNHLLLLVDGVPMNDNLYGSAYTWEITPLFMAKSLEVLRGPGSALYGSNATNGVVAINTLSASEIAGPGEARVRMGNNGGRQVDAITGLAGDHFSAVVAYSRFSTNGDEAADYDWSGTPDAGGVNLAKFKVWDKRSNDYFMGKLDGQGSLKGLSFQYHHQGWQFGTGHGWFFVSPDFAESMKEWRDIVSVAYRREAGAWSQEYVFRYQRHGIDWNQRYLPNGYNYFGTTYDAGIWEYLDTSSDEIFGRAQATYTFGKGGSVVFGMEGTHFTYDGDRSHTSNVDLQQFDATGAGSSTWYVPFASNATQNLRPWLEWTKGHPILKLGFYAQAASGKVLNERLSATLGVRYDRQSSDFSALDRPGIPTESLQYSRVSPRLALIYHGGDTFSTKLLVGQAFRTPAPTELFGANTASLASDPRGLKPEIIDTIELATDWTVMRNLSWKVNLFQTNFKNLIAYSVNSNLSANLYTLKTQGLETELNYGTGGFQGFLNVSYAKRVDEEIQIPQISRVPDEVTWAPSLTANLGFNYKNGPFTAGATVHHQGSVKRRPSDFDPWVNDYRPNTLGSWLGVDLRLAYKFSRGVEIELAAKNASDTEGRLIKNFATPFDYRTEPRRITLGIRIN